MGHTKLLVGMGDLVGGGYDSAGDGFAGEAIGGVDEVVGQVVDDEGFAAIDAVGVAGPEGDAGYVEGGIGGAVGTDDDVGQIAVVVAVGIKGAVLFLVGIEVGPDGAEVWRGADRVGVEVDSVLAGRQVFEGEVDAQIGTDLLEGDGAGIFVVAVAEFGDEAGGAIAALAAVTAADSPSGW